MKNSIVYRLTVSTALLALLAWTSMGCETLVTTNSAPASLLVTPTIVEFCDKDLPTTKSLTLKHIGATLPLEWIFGDIGDGDVHVSEQYGLSQGSGSLNPGDERVVDVEIKAAGDFTIKVEYSDGLVQSGQSVIVSFKDVSDDKEKCGCTPVCDGKSCNDDDGCGQPCGCPNGLTCESGVCQSSTTPTESLVELLLGVVAPFDLVTGMYTPTSVIDGLAEIWGSVPTQLFPVENHRTTSQAVWETPLSGQLRDEAWQRLNDRGDTPIQVSSLGANPPSNDYAIFYAAFVGEVFPVSDPKMSLQLAVVLRDQALATSNPGAPYIPAPGYPNDVWQGGTQIYSVTLTGHNQWQLVRYTADGTSLKETPSAAYAWLWRDQLRLFIPRGELSAESYGVRFTAFQHYNNQWLNSPKETLRIFYAPLTRYVVEQVLHKSLSDEPDFWPLTLRNPLSTTP